MLRRLAVEFADEVGITYVIGGMAQALEDRVAFASDWLNAAAASGMPVDPRGLLEDPPAATHPAGLAVKAAAEQGDPGPFLRRLREAIMVERRRLDRGDALLDVARETQPALRLDLLRVAFGSNAIVEALGADLERAKAAGEAGARVPLPTLHLRGPDDVLHALEGPQPYERIREAVMLAGAAPTGSAAPSVEEALRRFGSMATPEIAAACFLPGPRASAELWRLALEWRVTPHRVLGGELWRLAA
jgi:predicted DsbA family dithiol-disulfide isomerase